MRWSFALTGAIDLSASSREKGTMLRKTVVILAMLFSSIATQVFALGLGTVTVESALNQPLRVGIEILQLGDTRLQDVNVQMASTADFQRFNIDRASFLSNVRFTVATTADGNYVTLTSNQIVREPYLSFILDTRWPNGRLLSEHTILLDLPVFDDQQPRSTVRQPISPALQPPGSASQPQVTTQAPAPAVTPPASTAAPAVTPAATPSTEPEPSEPVVDEPAPIAEEPAPAPEPVAEPVASTPVNAAAAPDVADAVEQTITTSNTDTLSDIALQVRPNDSVTIQQTMLAIQRLNPDAFTDGNINRLRSGEVLRLPDLSEIQSVDSREAATEINRQNQDFATTDVQPLAAPATQTPGQAAAPQGQLSVVSGDDAIDASVAAGQLDSLENEALDQRIAELENQLFVQQEEADRARIAREELDQRMDELEQQIAAAQEIIRLQDLQLAQLQQSLAQAAAEQADQAEQAAAIAAAEAQVAQQTASRTGLVSDIMRIITGNILFVGFALVLVILLLVFLLLRRNRSKTDDSDMDELDGEPMAPRKTGADDEGEEEFQDYDDGDLDSELDQIIGIDAQADPIRQANILLQKGNTRRAVTLLLAAVDRNPENQQFRMKLLEALAEQGDLYAFEEQADLLVHDPALEKRVNALRDTIDVKQTEPEIAPVDYGKKQSTDEEDRIGAASFLDDLGIDLDAFDDDDEEPSITERSAKPEPVVEVKKLAAPSLDDDSFLAEDMDLTFDLAGDDDSAAADVSAEADDAALDIEAEPDVAQIGDLEQAIDLDLDDTLTGDDEISTTSAERDDDVLEFDMGDTSDTATSSKGSSKDAADLEIDALDFILDDDKPVAASATKEPVIELETFAFDAKELNLDVEKTAEPEKPIIDDGNLLDFDFDKTEIEAPSPAKETVASNDKLETFEFDLDADPVLDSAATVVEKPAVDGGLDIDIDDFDLDDFDLEDDLPAGNNANNGANANNDFLDLDAEVIDDAVIEPAEDDIEFDLDGDKPKAESMSDIVDDMEDELDDLEFLSDDDDVEIESVDDIEELDLMSDAEEVATKLELAYAYRKMGDKEGAKEILQEVIKEGSNEQIKEAKELMSSLDDND